jgi:two-component system sensor histidine kinase KdpD
MKENYLSSLLTAILNCMYTLISVAALTIIMKLIGRDILGEAVIALLYLLPIGWSTTRWGQGAGICAAVLSTLAFNYFFIPPFYTFAVGRLEGWLLLIIFLVVSIVVIGRIQTGLTRAINSEREAIFMYEMSSALAGLRTQEAVVHALATNLQLIFLAELVEVCVQSKINGESILVAVPPNVKVKGIPYPCPSGVGGRNSNLAWERMATSRWKPISK